VSIAASAIETPLPFKGKEKGWPSSERKVELGGVDKTATQAVRRDRKRLLYHSLEERKPTQAPKSAGTGVDEKKKTTANGSPSPVTESKSA